MSDMDMEKVRALMLVWTVDAGQKIPREDRLQGLRERRPAAARRARKWLGY